MKFYDEHRSERDLFEILALHTGDVKSLAELDQKLLPTIQEAWNGRPLPFPILLDGTGQTTRRYGIRALPTVILIDPEGKLVKGGGEKMLAQKLRDWRANFDAVSASLESPKNLSVLAATARNALASQTTFARQALEEFARRAEDAEVLATVLDVLAPEPDERILELLIGSDGLRSPEPTRVRAAARALGQTSSPAGLEALLEAAHKPIQDAELAAALCASLARLGPADERASDAALVLSRSTYRAVRASTIRELGAFRSEIAFARLLQALAEDPDARTRAFAAEALGRTGRADAIPVLELASSDDRVALVRRRARESLRSLARDT